MLKLYSKTTWRLGISEVGAEVEALAEAVGSISPVPIREFVSGTNGPSVGSKLHIHLHVNSHVRELGLVAPTRLDVVALFWFLPLPVL